jgi:hypothetical protein
MLLPKRCVRTIQIVVSRSASNETICKVPIVGSGVGISIRSPLNEIYNPLLLSISLISSPLEQVTGGAR